MALSSPICCICGNSICGKYYIDWIGHTVCASHIDLVARCASCGQFCNSKAKEIGLGMKVCVHCQKYRIEKEESHVIVEYIKNIYRNSPIGEVTHWHLKMVNALRLFEMTQDKNTRGLAQARGHDYTIFVYRELSRVAFAQVLAHEMLHVYQYVHHLSPPKAICEGFCNLGSYVVLNAINNKEAKAAIENLMNNSDPVYGDGFRQMLELFRHGGWEEAITKIRQ